MFNCCAGAIIDWTTKKNTAFADHLLKTLGKGAESCQGIQEAARCVVEESNGNCSELTKRFAKIGTSGRNPQNCEGDLFRLINLPVESWLCICVFFFHCSIISFQSFTKVSNVVFTSELYHCLRIQFLSSSLWKTRSRRIESDICAVQSSYRMSFCITWHPLVNSKLILKSFKNFGGFGHCTNHITQLQLKACIGHWDWEVMMQSTPWLAAKLSSFAWTISSLTASVAVNHIGEKLLWWLMVT